MDVKKLLKQHGVNLYEGHPLPVTRREFLAHGIGTAGAVVALPSILSILASNRAYGANCDAFKPKPSNRVPFIVFDLSGGGNIAGSNVIVGGAGGQTDVASVNYNTLGLPDAQKNNQNTDLGIAFQAQSAMLAGLKNKASAGAQAAMDGAILAGRSENDTQNNTHNPVYWIAKSGTSGSLTPLIGTSGNGSAFGRSQAAAGSVAPTVSLAQVNRPQSAINMVDPGQLRTLFATEANIKRVLDAASRMSEAAVARFSAQPLPDQIRDLVSCGYVNSADSLSVDQQAAINPLADTDIQAAFAGNFGLAAGGNQETFANNQTGSNSELYRTAAVAKMVIDGWAGAGTIEFGGFDYHNNSRTSTDAKDFKIGQLIGSTIEYARRKGKSVMIYVISDGGLNSNQAQENGIGANGATVGGKFQWSGDSATRASTLMLVYNAGGARAGIKRQVGAFRNNGEIDLASSAISNDVNVLAQSVVLNYLALHGEVARLDDIVGANPLSANLNQFLCFNKIA